MTAAAPLRPRWPLTTRLLRRVLQAAAALLLLSIGVFGLLWLLPGGPRQAMLSGAAGGTGAARLRHDYGLETPR